MELVYQPFNPKEQKEISFEYTFALIPHNIELFEKYCEATKIKMEKEIRYRDKLKTEDPAKYEKYYKNSHLESYSPAVRKNIADVILEFHGITRNNPEIADFLADQQWYPVKGKRKLDEDYRQFLLKESSREIKLSSTK